MFCICRSDHVRLGAVEKGKYELTLCPVTFTESLRSLENKVLWYKNQTAVTFHWLFPAFVFISAGFLNLSNWFYLVRLHPTCRTTECHGCHVFDRTLNRWWVTRPQVSLAWGFVLTVFSGSGKAGERQPADHQQVCEALLWVVEEQIPYQWVCAQQIFISPINVIQFQFWFKPAWRLWRFF